MRVLNTAYLVAFGYVGTVVAAPSPQSNQGQCRGVDFLISLLRSELRNEVNSWCSDFLKYPRTTTKVVTSTTQNVKTVTVPPPDATTTKNIFSTVSNVVTNTITTHMPNAQTTETVFTTTTVPAGGGNPNKLRKRGGIPPKIAAYASKQISAACSCVVPTTTTTVFQTSFVTLGSRTTTVTSDPTHTVDVTRTSTVYITNTEVETKTLPPTGTDTVTTTSITTETAAASLQICGGAWREPNSQAVEINTVSMNYGNGDGECVILCQGVPECRTIRTYYSNTAPLCIMYDKLAHEITDPADEDQGYPFYDYDCEQPEQ